MKIFITLMLLFNVCKAQITSFRTFYERPCAATMICPLDTVLCICEITDTSTFIYFSSGRKMSDQ